MKIGLINDTSEEILDGLQDGETVVLTNQDKLKNGARVEVAEENMEADGE